MKNDDKLVKEILVLALSATPENVGDIYISAVDLYKQITGPWLQQNGEYYIAQIRSLARKAEIGWRLFANPPSASSPLDEEQQIQLIALIATLHSFCYGAERLDEASFHTGPDSTPVRFYINSLYHFIAALYLLDKGTNLMGGMVYKTLKPMDLEHLLVPVQPS
jgi:hypothetical protein